MNSLEKVRDAIHKKVGPPISVVPMNKTRFPEIIRELYRLIDELEQMFPGRHFTPDGHLVGSIGEARGTRGRS